MFSLRARASFPIDPLPRSSLSRLPDQRQKARARMADQENGRGKQSFWDIAAPVGMIIALLGALVTIVLEFSM